jgi:hypothetical protein
MRMRCPRPWQPGCALSKLQNPALESVVREGDMIGAKSTPGDEGSVYSLKLPSPKPDKCRKSWMEQKTAPLADLDLLTRTGNWLCH